MQRKRAEEIKEIKAEIEEDTKNFKNSFAAMKEKLNTTRELLDGIYDEITF